MSNELINEITATKTKIIEFIDNSELLKAQEYDTADTLKQKQRVRDAIKNLVNAVISDIMAKGDLNEDFIAEIYLTLNEKIFSAVLEIVDDYNLAMIFTKTITTPFIYISSLSIKGKGVNLVSKIKTISQQIQAGGGGGL